MELVMQVYGIDGDSTLKGYEKWFTLSNIIWSEAQVGQGVSKVVAGAMTVTKKFGRGTPRLFFSCPKGATIRNITIAAVKSGLGGEIFAQYFMESCIISGYQVTGNVGESNLAEEVSITFQRMTVKNFLTNEQAGWDYATNSAI